MKKSIPIVYLKMILAIVVVLWLPNMVKAQPFTLADTLRGSNTAERKWWDVQRYDISVTPNFILKKISGSCVITYKVLDHSKQVMQIDLQSPLMITSVIQNGKMATARQVSPFVYLVESDRFYRGNEGKLIIHFEGTPLEAIRPPWDGGWIWKKDSLGRPWMSVACQGLGASVWYPCKDYQGDEPDRGASLAITVPDSLQAISNGRLISVEHKTDKTCTWNWEVKSPINNYNIIPYIGKYLQFTDTLQGEKGELSLDYWVLDYHLKQAQKQFEQVKPMLHCFEEWMGPYPFYNDGYKLVEAPHLGMEHQSAVAYGNQFINGYRGTDLSGSGWGLLWDFIIVHESGHEWFGNNITSIDIADMWVHESFTNYSETIYTGCIYGVNAGKEYNQGIRKNIRNDKPIVGWYGVNNAGSGDMYYKGSNMLQTIRHSINNDETWKQILRGLNNHFYHQTITGVQIQKYINKLSAINFDKVFAQYLQTTQIPQLTYYKKNNGDVCVKWDSCITGFNLPIVFEKDGHKKRITPSASQWKKVKATYFDTEKLQLDYYIKMNDITRPIGKR
jgi:aminopeptidase N